MEDMTLKSCRSFAEALASDAPTPGGGGASALAGALAAAVGHMVGALTVGKKKYADVEDEIRELMKRGEALQESLLDLVAQDAEVFAPLAAAYGMPKDTEEQRAEKDRVMETCLHAACTVPMQIMEACCGVIDLATVFAEKGSRLAVSAAGVSAVLAGAALEGASLNVFINTKSMKDRVTAAALEAKANGMLDVYTVRAAEVFRAVREAL
jgi:formiminotetrahydrofolate cyclodeaminase